MPVARMFRAYLYNWERALDEWTKWCKAGEAERRTLETRGGPSPTQHYRDRLAELGRGDQPAKKRRGHRDPAKEERQRPRDGFGDWLPYRLLRKLDRYARPPAWRQSERFRKIR